MHRARYWRQITRSAAASGIAIRNNANWSVCQRHAKISPDLKSNGYPADKSIFYCNLKLGLLNLQVPRDSWHVPCRHRSRRCLSCWRAARCSWSRSLLLFHPSVNAPLLGDNTRFSVSVPWTQFLLQASSSRVNVGHVSQGVRGRLRPVRACAYIQPAKWTLRTITKVASHPLSFYQLQKLSSPCATRWFGSHCQGAKLGKTARSQPAPKYIFLGANIYN